MACGPPSLHRNAPVWYCDSMRQVRGDVIHEPTGDHAWAYPQLWVAIGGFGPRPPNKVAAAADVVRQATAGNLAWELPTRQALEVPDSSTRRGFGGSYRQTPVVEKSQAGVLGHLGVVDPGEGYGGRPIHGCKGGRRATNRRLGLAVTGGVQQRWCHYWRARPAKAAVHETVEACAQRSWTLPRSSSWPMAAGGAARL